MRVGVVDRAELCWPRARYRDQLHWRRVFGVQVHDLAGVHPREDPESSAEAFRAEWVDVAGHTGAPIARAIEWSSMSSRRASCAAKAAQLQGAEIAERVLRRLREAVLVAGQPVDTPSRIVAAVAGVSGLDVSRLLARCRIARDPGGDPRGRRGDARPGSQGDRARVREPEPGAARPAGERLRYAFPTLIFSGPSGRRIVPGWRTAETYDDAVRAVAPDARPSHSSPMEAEYRSLTLADLELLTGSQLPPLDAVPIITATTPLFVHRDEAADGPFARLADAVSSR